MKPSSIFAVLTTLVLVFVFTFAASTAIAEEGSGPIVKVVKSVGDGKIEVQFSRGERSVVHSYAVTGTTAITINNAAGTLADVKPGMTVNEVAPKEGGPLTSLSVSDKQ